MLTPRDLEQKAKLVVRFAQAKTAEYQALRIEIDLMRQETERQQRPE